MTETEKEKKHFFSCFDQVLTVPMITALTYRSGKQETIPEILDKYRPMKAISNHALKEQKTIFYLQSRQYSELSHKGRHLRLNRRYMSYSCSTRENLLTITSIKYGKKHLKNKHHNQHDNRRNNTSFWIATKYQIQCEIRLTKKQDRFTDSQ